MSEQWKSEAHQQAACFEWFCRTFPAQRPMMFCIYNNPPNAVVAGMLKSMGMRRGVSDMCYFAPRRELHWIEQKLVGERQSSDQVQFQGMVEQWGFKYHLNYSLAQFQEIVLNLNG